MEPYLKVIEYYVWDSNCHPSDVSFMSEHGSCFKLLGRRQFTENVAPDLETSTGYRSTMPR